jgi:putative ABC transport system substrate-binding protein
MASWATLAGVSMLALFAVSLVVDAQQARLYRVGVVLQGGDYLAAVDGLRDGLKELGFEEGKQLVLHVRDAKGDLKSVETVARGLEEEHVDLIYSLATSVTLAVKQVTKRVPIVFYAGTDPVSVGLVDSFPKPGGRLTGIYGHFTEMTAKRLELLKEMVPRVRRPLVFYNPDNRAAQESLTLARDAARQLDLKLIERPVTSVEELRAGLRALRPGEADALTIVSDAMVVSRQDLLIEAATAKRLPTMLTDRASVSGALAGMGEPYYRIGRLSAKPIQRVLLGANPGDLPIDQLDRLHFVVNLKTAKALGLTIPRAVLARADEIIE